MTYIVLKLKNKFLAIVYFALFLSSLFFAKTTWGETEGLLNKLLAPGPLISGHRELESKDCLKCHDAGKGISESKCLSCHKEIKPFLDADKGFHGLASKSQTCIQCHFDHKGRSFDSTLVNKKSFDHAKLTGYSLDGKHNELKCEECHTNKRTKKEIRKTDIRFLGTQATSCKSCHKKDDIHNYTGDFSKKDCNTCHNNLSWKDNIKFNHNKDTKFKLEEKHSTLKCNDCHLTNKSKKLFQYQWGSHLEQKQCLTCHQDFHKNKLSTKLNNGNCLNCHDQSKWPIDNFNHGVSGFKLQGKHNELTCAECHLNANKPTKNKSQIKVKDLTFTGLKSQCLSCHKNSHQNIKMNECSKCHQENSWHKTLNFDHNTQTHFALDGKHSDLKCNDCHLPQPQNSQTIKRGLITLSSPTYHWEKLNLKTCESCHSSPHKAEFSKELLANKCTTCHTTQDWYTQKSQSGFDHAKTRFTLTGAHTKTRCNDCHGENKKKIFKFNSIEQKFCIDCHSNIHENQFSKNYSTQNCSACHSTDKFNHIQNFNHDLTNFKLTGKHKDTKCSECHTPTVKNYELKWPNLSKLNKQSPSISKFKFDSLKSNSCRECHDDYHKGQLSQSCSQCHTENGWKPTTFNHNEQSRFHLLGKHTELKCEKCHESTKDLKPLIHFKPLSNQCSDCHKDGHKGNFGKSCQECHNEKGWKSTKDFHKNFTLSGLHFTLECSECHKDGKKLSGLSQQCIACHQKDDVHNGSSPNCNNCHTQHFWEITSFRHSLTKFPLRGAHRAIECSECHIGGVYKGLSNSCVSCHINDFNANPAPHTSGNTNCITCHKNTFTFSGSH